MKQSIQNGIGQCGISDVSVPSSLGKMGCDNGGTGLVAIRTLSLSAFPDRRWTVSFNSPLSDRSSS